MTRYRPVAETADTVTLRRADYDAMVGALEEAADLAAVREVSARVAAGEDEYVPTAVIERLAAGQHPVRVWREHRGLTGRALAQAAQVPASYLCEIEAGRKPGSFQAMAAIAAALRIDMEDLKPWPQAQSALTEVFCRDPTWCRGDAGKDPGRFGALEDLVGAAVFLCSDAARQVTGQLLYIDGGQNGALGLTTAKMMGVSKHRTYAMLARYTHLGEGLAAKLA